ncbi:UNKNOWN [Stylonychia lemnae]|uniref:Uncharacterized protein n=1 Tax=Stylonychia lemnae TaxID=5949 RepID=A0A078AU68_STYLE|nr:UNKNOWN [Stylonychia lemnae]|eukprot:CDW84787.1 UNKNOWN [Stylonychia lemnae]
MLRLNFTLNPSMDQYLNVTKNITQCCINNWPWYPQSPQISGISSDQTTDSMDNSPYQVNDEIFLKMKEIIRSVLEVTLNQMNQTRVSLDVIQQVIPCAFQWYPWIVALNRNINSYSQLQDLLSSSSLIRLDALLNGPETNNVRSVFIQSLLPWVNKITEQIWPWGPQYNQSLGQPSMDDQQYQWTIKNIQDLLSNFNGQTSFILKNACWYRQMWPFIMASQENIQENFEQMVQDIIRKPQSEIYTSISDIMRQNGVIDNEQLSIIFKDCCCK